MENIINLILYTMSISFWYLPIQIWIGMVMVELVAMMNMEMKVQAMIIIQMVNLKLLILIQFILHCLPHGLMIGY